MSLIRNLIRLGTITQIFNKFGIIRSQATSLDAEDPENVINLHPYGFNASPPIGSNIVIMSVFGHLENKYGIPYNPTDANKQKLQEGESVIYNHFGSQIYLKANGDIEIAAAKNVNITATQTSTSGTIDATGAINTAAVYKVDGVQVVTNQQPAITPPTGGTTVDTEARAAINQIITTMQTHGLIS